MSNGFEEPCAFGSILHKCSVKECDVRQIPYLISSNTYYRTVKLQHILHTFIYSINAIMHYLYTSEIFWDRRQTGWAPTGNLKIGLPPPTAADRQPALWNTNMCMTTHNDPWCIYAYKFKCWLIYTTILFWSRIKSYRCGD